MAEKRVERFGSAINNSVVTQIKQREEAFGSSNKTVDQLKFITSNTSWVKLRSSVNKVSLKEAKSALQNNSNLTTLGDSIPAQNYVLLGGTLNPESRTPRSGILRSPNSDNPNAGGKPASLYRDTEAYLNYKSTGIRPMPGVTGMSVKHKNTYGTLLEATVNFNVWSKEQLEDIELLYFRPGYTALLEWGHSVYLDNGGNVQVASDSMTISEDLFFKNQNQILEIDKEIIKRRELYKGNYQGMFGFITNFNWSFRNDGGYDCSVKIISRGVVIESLQSPTISQGIPDKELPSLEEQKEKERKKDAEGLKSYFSYLDSCLQNYNGDEYSFQLFDYLTESGNYKKYKANAKTLAKKINAGFKNNTTEFNTTNHPTNYKAWTTEIKETEDEPSWWNLFVPRGRLFWIDMKTFLSMINELYLLKNPDNDRYITAISLEYGEKYKSFKNHFSLDPLVAMIPRIPTKDPDFVIRLDGGNSINKDMQSSVVGGNTKEDSIRDIMNIMLSTSFLAKTAESIISSTQPGVGVLDYIKQVLSGINAAFGGINNLDLFYDHDSCILKVIDRGSPTTSVKYPVINVTGLKNTVSELNIQSKISSNISSQISIAAQGHSGTYGENLKAMLQWNAGALDRHITRKDQGTESSSQSSDASEGRLTLQEALEKAFSQFNSAKIIKGNVNLRLWGQIRNEGTHYINQMYLESINKEPGAKFEPMPVPVTLSLKMLGISGIKIASTFKINNLALPSKYNKYAFLVTGVDHEIGTDNKWYTTVTANFYAAGL